jgi:hypothetical protein
MARDADSLPNNCGQWDEPSLRDLRLAPGMRFDDAVAA